MPPVVDVISWYNPFGTLVMFHSDVTSERVRTRLSKSNILKYIPKRKFLFISQH